MELRPLNFYDGFIAASWAETLPEALRWNVARAGPVVHSAVSPYSPADQRVLGGD